MSPAAGIPRTGRQVSSSPAPLLTEKEDYRRRLFQKIIPTSLPPASGGRRATGPTLGGTWSNAEEDGGGGDFLVIIIIHQHRVCHLLLLASR